MAPPLLWLQNHSISAALSWNVWVSIGWLYDDEALTVLLGVVEAQELYDDPMWPECPFLMSRLDGMPHVHGAETKFFGRTRIVNLRRPDRIEARTAPRSPVVSKC
jgi:hypothetical protein